MTDELAKVEGHFDGIYYCPHHPEENCECRKPKPKMILKILEDFKIPAKNTLMVGDDNGEGLYFAKRGDSDNIYLISEEQRDVLDQTIRSLR